MTGSYTFAGKVIPLPPGEWRLATSGERPGRTTDGTMATAMRSVTLPQDRGGLVAAVVSATAASEMGTVMNPSGICINERALRRDVVVAIAGQLDCRGIVVVATGSNPTRPSQTLAVQVLQSQRHNTLVVEYRFTPAAYVNSGVSPATKSEPVRQPSQQEIVERLSSFASRAREEVRRGLHGGQPTAALPSPF